MFLLGFFKSLFNFRHEKKQLLHIVLASFLVSFAIARVYSLFVGGAVYIAGYHIHHFYFGMMVLSIGGLIGLLSRDRRMLRMASLLIGTGLGLFADEVGLLLNCTTLSRTCAYAFPDTLDIIGAISLFILCLVMLTDVVEKFYLKKNRR